MRKALCVLSLAFCVLSLAPNPKGGYRTGRLRTLLLLLVCFAPLCTLGVGCVATQFSGVADLQKQIEELTRENQDLTKKLVLLDEAYIELSKKFYQVNAQIEYLRLKGNISEKVIGPVVIKGKTLAISETGKIVIIKYDKEDNFKEGMQLNIYRYDQIIGKAIVDKIGEKYCSIKIIEMFEGMKFRVTSVEFKPIEEKKK